MTVHGKEQATDTGEALRTALARRGWTQADLANALGINSGTVNNWCTSRRRPNVTFARRSRRSSGCR